MFRVGDRIEIVDPDAMYVPYEKGDVVTISGFDRDGDWVDRWGYCYLETWLDKGYIRFAGRRGP